MVERVQREVIIPPRLIGLCMLPSHLFLFALHDNNELSRFIQPVRLAGG
jgi:hypothetical protein